MKKLFRYICVGFFLLFAWPFFLYRKYGNKKYKLEGKTIIIANHYSNFDPFFIWMIFHKKKIRFVTIVETKKKLFTRFLTWLFDCLYIDYESKNLQFFRDCLRTLKENGIICIFPEGGVNVRKYGFFDFQGSFLFFARKTGANILPLYIYPEVRFFKRSSVYIGDPITPEEYGKYEDDDIAATIVQSRIMDYSFLVPQGEKTSLDKTDFEFDTEKKD